MPEPGKPKIYVSAILCDKLLREKDSDLLSAIQIGQGYRAAPVVFTPTNENGESDRSRDVFYWTPIKIFAVINFLSDSPAEFSYYMRGIAPDGTIMQPSPAQTLSTGGGAAGYSLVTTIKLVPEKEGDHWFEVYVDDELVNKMALRIIHEKDVIRVSPRPSESPSASE
jgi:hypothetical protein